MGNFDNLSLTTSDNLDLSFDTEELKWLALVQKNPVANGKFVYGVTSTKVFCRPICAARIPRRTNAVFFPDPVSAIAAGYRPCLRCSPDSDHHSPTSTRAATMANACRTIETTGKVGLNQLAKESGLSKFHFQRTFKSVMGITPQQYKMAHQSSVHVAPKSSKRVMFALGSCYLGHILVAVSDRGICAIELGDDPDLLIAQFQERFPSAEICANDPQFNNLVSVLCGAAESSRLLEWQLPLDIQGTAFQHRVWNALREIPWGQTRTYADIARNIGSPAAVRAVAKACAANPVAIAIPCHRVVRLDNHPSGYRWGLERKEALHQLESEAMEQTTDFEDFKRWVEDCMQMGIDVEALEGRLN